jgi:hypothetical protein
MGYRIPNNLPLISPVWEWPWQAAAAAVVKHAGVIPQDLAKLGTLAHEAYLRVAKTTFTPYEQICFDAAAEAVLG